jgi:DNA-binding NtrC family response regulator
VSARAVLVVDPDPAARRSARRTLEAAGWPVRTAAGAAEARRRAATREPAVVLLELGLPDGDGLALLAELRATWPELAAIVASAGAAPRDIVAAMRQGALDYLPKPVEPTALVAACRAAAPPRRAPAAMPAAPPLVGESAAAARVREAIRRLARRRPPGVLLVGEDGVGKTWHAQCLHAMGPRSASPCLSLACATAFAPEVALFGAGRSAGGLVAGARGGTLILDEVDRLPPATARRLVETIAGCGAAAPMVIGLATGILPGAPLTDWLGEVTVSIPALRERPDDVAPLARHFLARSGRKLRRRFAGLDAAAETALLRHDWPGNVRELAGVIERAAQLAPAGALGGAHLRVVMGEAAPAVPAARGSLPPLREVADAYVDHVLVLSGGNRSRAARILGVSRETLRCRLRGRAVS